jgi:hypothetical protein
MSRARTRVWLGFHTRAVRAQAALFVWAFLAGNLAGLIHAATTVHTRCLEHGELVDGVAVASEAEPGIGIAAARARACSPQPRAGQSIRALPGGSSEHHAHCAAAYASYQHSGPAIGSSTGPAPSPAVRQPAMAEDDSGSHGRGLYRTAPKTSPPVA